MPEIENVIVGSAVEDSEIDIEGCLESRYIDKKEIGITSITMGSGQIKLEGEELINNKTKKFSFKSLLYSIQPYTSTLSYIALYYH